MPAYNHERFIRPAVDSVLNQSFADLELIVIDDGSTDKTGEILRSYQDPRLSYFYQENQDAPNTINRGLSMARGEFISIINSDDIYHPQRIERILAFIGETEAKGGEVEAVFTDLTPISDSGEELRDPNFGWNIWRREIRAFFFEVGDLYACFLRGNPMVTTSNLFMRRRAAEKVGKFAPFRYMHDHDYLSRLMLAYPDGVHYMADDRLISYRIHSSNTLKEAAIGNPAAVTARRQNQALTIKYMLAAVPEDCRTRVKAGADRLVTLGDQIQKAQSALPPTNGHPTNEHQPQFPPGVRLAAKDLSTALRRWVRKKAKKLR